METARALLYEDDVVLAVADHLRATGWTVESLALATQHGDDIVARRGDELLLVEAKGEGSSKDHTRRFGQPFTRSQVGSHVAVAVLRALRVHSEQRALAGLAFPDNAHHRHFLEGAWPALERLGIAVFWVNDQRQVRAQPQTR